jgi:hypothetical protein
MPFLNNRSYGCLTLLIVAVCGFPIFVLGVFAIVLLIPGRFGAAWTFAPNSNAFQIAVVNSVGRIPRDLDTADSSTIRLTLISNGGQAVSRSYEFHGDEKVLPDPAAILALLQSIGIDVDDQARLHEAEELCTQIQRAAYGTYGPPADLRTMTLRH